MKEIKENNKTKGKIRWENVEGKGKAASGIPDD